jgi:hypothetical protein
MIGLFRRISQSVIPRPDRPWEEDGAPVNASSQFHFHSLTRDALPTATSHAPKVGRKRRMSDEDDDAKDDDALLRKKAKPDSSTSADKPSESEPAVAQADSAEVKEVTKGVQEVELDDRAPVSPESVPLPDEEADGELDESADETPGPAEETKSAAVVDQNRDVNQAVVSPDDDAARVDNGGEDGAGSDAVSGVGSQEGEIVTSVPTADATAPAAATTEDAQDSGADHESNEPGS